MFKLKTYKNQKINTTLLCQILFYAFPLTFIIGNLIVSLNTLLFICVSLYLIKNKNLVFRFTASEWILILFFSYLLILTTIQLHYPGYVWNSFSAAIEETYSIEPRKDRWAGLAGLPALKAFLQIRFLILIFVIDTLLFNKILDLKKFLLSSLIFTTFVSIDILFQYINGFDVFGNKTEWRYNSGPFGDEKIAGTYLKNFSFFSFFYIFFISKKNKLFNLIIISVIVLHLTSALLAGQRMPFILFLFGCGLVFLLIKNFRFTMSVSLILFLSIFYFLIKSDPLIKSAYGGFVANINISKAISYIKNKPLFKNIEPGGYSEITNLEYSEQSFLSHSSESDLVNEEIVLFRHSGHNRVFRTAVEIFKQSPFTGFGLKSFRIKCSVILIEDTRKNTIGRQKFSCGNHPHNYYLEILSEVGLIGLFLMIFFISILLKNSFEYLRKYNKDNNSDILLILPAAISFFIDIWPIKSTGSFFTTWNATFFWITAGILIAFTRKTNLKS